MAFRSISSLSGQAGVVSSIVMRRRSRRSTTFLTMSRVTMSRPSSGSWTVRSASMTASWVRLGIGGGPSQVGASARVLTSEASISYRALARKRGPLRPRADGRRVDGFAVARARRTRRISHGSRPPRHSSVVWLTPHPPRPYPRRTRCARTCGRVHADRSAVRTCRRSTSSSSMWSSNSAMQSSSTTSTSRSATGSSSACSGRPAAARRPRCG